MKEINESLEVKMRMEKEQLVIRSRQLALQLNRLANRLDKKDWLEEVRLVSDLGEIQVQGLMIDVHCASLRAYQKIYDEIVKMEKKNG